ncbi:MAG: glycosyltransferase [Acidobacteria bacterium]|nr:MAG: glycosyltransferase [Acidobacteriota bacterium]
MRWRRKTSRRVVAHLKPDYLPLSETFVYEILRALTTFTPVVLCQELMHREHFPLSHIIHLRMRPTWWGERLSDALRRRIAGVDTIFAYKYYRAVKTLKPVLVHAHFGPSGAMAVPIRRKLGLPLITSFYGYDVPVQGKLSAWRELYGPLFEAGDLFLVEGPCLRRHLIALGAPPERVTIQRIAIDVEHIPFRPRRVARRGECVQILQVGRMVEKKGFEYTVRAFAEVHRAHPHTRLLFIGDGPLRPSLQALVSELKLDRVVRFLGFQSRPAYMAIAERCHILVQPSVTASDGDTEGGAPTVCWRCRPPGCLSSPLVTPTSLTSSSRGGALFWYPSAMRRRWPKR